MENDILRAGVLELSKQAQHRLANLQAVVGDGKMVQFSPGVKAVLLEVDTFLCAERDRIHARLEEVRPKV